MTIHVALLRGVNVGGHRKVAMSDLRDLLTELGFQDARSLLQTGNLVFRSRSRASVGLERLLAAKSEKRLGLCTDFFVRSASEWAQVIARNPFGAEAERDPARLVVLFLRDAPAAGEVKSLQAAITGPERVRARGKQAYVVYPAGIGRSRLTNAMIEKKLATRATGRNWNTVLKLGALAGSSA